jgi:trk system potassium uptake protein TrkA
MKKIQICVIGLGKFGVRFAEFMAEQGHEVVGIDMDEEKISKSKYFLAQGYHVDEVDREVLSQVGIKEFSHVFISVGDSITSSMMISLYLKEFEIENIWVKAVNHDHEKLLNMIGVDRVIIPEEMAASQLANELTMPGFIDYIPFDSDMIIKEIIVDKWSGKSFRDLDITNRFGIQAIAVKSKLSDDFTFIPKADLILGKNDVVVVIGNKKDLKKIKS